MTWYQIDNARPTFRIAVGTQDAGWFMDGKIEGAMSLQRFAVDRDLDLIYVDFYADLGNRLSIDLNSTVRNEFVYLSTRAQACCG